MANVGPDLVAKFRKVHNTAMALPPPGAEMDLTALKRYATKKRQRESMQGDELGFRVRIPGPKKIFKTVTSPKAMMRLAKDVSGKGLHILAMAFKGIGKLAALPLRKLFRKLGMRRAKYLAWHNRKSPIPNSAEKAQAARWTARKFSGNPLGKLAVLILKETWGVSSVGASIAGAGWIDRDATGMTGAEIAAAVATIIGALTALIKSLNKPGEAPADAQAAEPAPPGAEQSSEASGWIPPRAGRGLPVPRRAACCK